MRVLDYLRVVGATRNDWYLDAALAVMAVAALHIPYVVAYLLLFPTVETDSIVVMTIAGAIVCVSVTLRHHHPLPFFVIVVMAIGVQIALMSPPSISWIVILLALFDVSRWMPLRISFGSLILGLVTTGLGVFRWMRAEVVSGTDLRLVVILVGISGAATLTAAYSVGRRGYDVAGARARQLLAEKDAAELQIAEQTARQRSLEASIRTTIARELHDIVAHSISVMVVQAEGGLAQAAYSPHKAKEVLTNISDTGRESLQEMRRIVRMLRSEAEGEMDLYSAPRIEDISGLIENAHASYAVTGTPHGVTPIVEMTVYRVVQEALTNSLKHAGPDAEPQVSLDWGPTHVSIEVTNKETNYPSPHDSGGTGLMGMAERVLALDGTLDAGPNEQGGFLVCAKIPLQ